MKRILLLVLLLLSLNSQAFANWCDNANMEACYTMDSDSGTGTSLTDDSANSNTGTFKGSGEPAWSSSVPQQSDGFDGTSTYSVDFDGSGDYIRSADLDPITALTYGGWSYIDNNSGNYYYICSEPASNSSCTNPYSNYSVAQGYVSGVPISEWHHYVGWYNGTTMKLYFDGVETASASKSGTVNDTNALFEIGDQGGCATATNGKTDEVFVIFSALDLTDINDIMENGLVQAVTATKIYGATLNGATIN